MASADGDGALPAGSHSMLLSPPALPLTFDGRPVIFVGGKGGVGKTTTAAALGLGFAERGERVLVVSTDPAHSLGDLFEQRLGADPVALLDVPGGGGHLAGLEIDAEQEVERYLASVRDAMRAFVRPALYGEVERQIELTRESPGAAEAALMERVAELVVTGPEHWDRILFDTAPTGHTLRLLALPELMSAWTDGLLRQRERADDAARAMRAMGSAMGLGDGGAVGGGAVGDGGGAAVPRGASGPEAGADAVGGGAEPEPAGDPRMARLRERLLARRQLFAQVRRALLDPDRVGFVLVLIPERLPILETEMAHRTLVEHRIPVLGLVVNRVLPTEPLGAFLEARREQEGRYLAQIGERFGGVARVHVPLARHDVVGMAAIREMARSLMA
jgi:arsenite/tail-anchored protein-transporting ATPase